MDESERRIAMSFRAVKKDILEMKDQILRLAETQEKIESALDDIKKKDSLVQIKSKPASKKTSKKKTTKKKSKK
ncbi:hypothetical protein CMI42_03310 [Candidatus Pacearchaeota archaeon]|nr:hypothetical protein [Candidatus Pacearchaeota archaeon]|tara:strand:- start:2826 stop:3047 length:222 start_codon:yes stop_codon:yes gene_type:complete